MIYCNAVMENVNANCCVLTLNPMKLRDYKAETECLDAAQLIMITLQ